MHRVRIPTAVEIRRLLLFLLGRQPSERALVELSQRPIGVSADLILLGTEFESVVRRGVTGDEMLPHHRHSFSPTRPELRWFGDLLGLSIEAQAALERTTDWRGLAAVLLRDAELLSRMRAEWTEHGRLQAFEHLTEEVAKRFPTLEVAAAATSPHRHSQKGPQSDSAQPKQAGINNRSGKPASKSGQPATATLVNRTTKPVASNTAPKEATPRLSAPALDCAEAMRTWQRIVADPANPQVRSALYEAFWHNDKLILFLNAKLDDARPGQLAPTEALIRLLAARVFLRLFMSRSAWHAAHAALAVDTACPGALRESDRNRLLKVLATAAVRIGRVEEATSLLRQLVRENPLDWEAHIGLADIIGSTEPEVAAELYAIAMHLNPELKAAGRLSVVEFLYSINERIGARKIVLDMMKADMALPECHLALGNMALSEGDRRTWQARLRSFFAAQDVAAPSFDVPDKASQLFGLAPSGLPQGRDNPLVTIITTAYNAAETITGSMRSALDQTCGNLELLVVDDCSTDNTVDLVHEMAQRDPRVRLMRNPFNMGTYCSKNRAIREARGAFVTLHDSDDWMHPQRIEMHLRAMLTGEPAASMSNWVRMEATGRTVLRKGGGYIHRNPASTFIRREVFDRIGLFDSVRVGADSEFLWRMRHALGANSVANIEVSLGLGLHHEKSLTQSGVAAFDEFRFSPVRLDYAEAWGTWQVAQLNAGRKLYVDFPQSIRAFPAPDTIAVMIQSEPNVTAEASELAS